MRHALSLSIVGLAALLALPAGDARAAEVTPQDEYARHIQSHQTIQPHGSTPFGEQVNLYTGALSFRQTDIVLEGTGPDIALVRNTASRARDTRTDAPYAFADWTLSIPRIETLVDKAGGWFIAAADKYKRCSQFDRPWYSTHIEKGWYGVHLVDGAGHRQQLLKRSAANTLQPTMQDAGGKPMAFPIVTQELWQVACLPATRNGEPGEAFLAIDPAGTKYYFDHLVYDTADTITEKDMGTIIRQRRSLATMFASRIVDRFGNTVTFHYGGDATLDAITADDGREVAIAWRTDARLIDRITVQPKASQPRTWRYEYQQVAAGWMLSAVVLPDQSRWTFGLSGIGGGGALSNALSKCTTRTLPNGATPMVSTMTTPSGLAGRFEVTSIWHARSYVPSACLQDPGTDPREDIPPLFGTNSLTRKEISGPGIAPMAWTYAYAPAVGSTTSDACATSATCADTKWTSIVGPDGNKTVYTHRNRWGATEGKLAKIETFQGTAGTPLRTETFAYASPHQGPWPGSLGYGFDDPRSNASRSTTWTPQVGRSIVQAGKTYTWQASAFDAYGRALTVTRSSNLGTGHARTDTTAYYDNRALWVLGQARSSTNQNTHPASVESRTVFNDATALPTQTFAFEKLQQTLTYDARGNLASVSDGRDSPAFDTTVTFADWKRGIPQTIRFPDGRTRTASVDDFGQIGFATDENGYATCHRFDVAGQLTKTTWPSETVAGACDTAGTTWNALDRVFERVGVAEHGLAAGHWRERVTLGGSRKFVYYDALWRPVLTTTYDIDDIDGTLRHEVVRYDAADRVAFRAYPTRTAIADFNQALRGTRTAYDALGRPTRVEQDADATFPGGIVATKTDYDAGTERVTDARGHATVTHFLAYDAPTTDWPLQIQHPDDAVTDIKRDVFGKPTSLTRRDAAGTASATRAYHYNASQELCRRVEPETGSTLMGYDAAGNLAWHASGYAPDAGCAQASWVANRRVDRTYDARNRLATLVFADGRGNTTYAYHPDGLQKSLTVDNGDGNRVTTSYDYNRRRLLTREMLAWNTLLWSVTYGYDRNGHLAHQGYPGGLTVPYAPNALGQATQAGTFATNVRYHPNGALAAFTYGNGITHTLAQNARGWPERSRDAKGATAVLDDSYDYDANGNVAAISDGAASHRGDRTMTYDKRDRLTAVASPMYGNGTIYYGYDALDNISVVSAWNRSQRYCHDASNRLAFVRTPAASTCPGGGAATTTFTYDLQGNVASKNNVAYQFDLGNRLRSTTGGVVSSYVYDALGRRVRDYTTASRYSMYTQSGQIAYVSDARKQHGVQHVYLDDRLIATRTLPSGSTSAIVEYQHTDALGSPVVATDASGNVVERSEYEPYGKVVNRATADGAGFTGHVEDAATGLTYMQQRYYDASVGRFLGVDPVVADGATGGNFNRYWYANNSPYRFTDPDGRLPILAPIVIGIGWLLTSGDANAPAIGGYTSAMSASEATATFANALPMARLNSGIRIAADAAQSSRGANSLKPDAAANGAHSTIKRDAGGNTINTATYAPNARNPSGFQEVKRVDVTGKAHTNPDGVVVPTPHVKEAGVKGVRPAEAADLPLRWP